MQNQLFRQKSIDRISSPEQLRDYMRVTSPRLWLLLAAIMALLIGFLIYASTTQMESTIALRMAYFNPAYIYGEISSSQLEIVKIGMPVRIGGLKGKVSSTSTEARYRMSTSLDGNMKLPDGSYVMTFGDSMEADPYSDTERKLFVECSNGVLSCWPFDSDMNVSTLFGNGDMRVRIWSVDYANTGSSGGPSTSGSYLATVSGGEIYAVGSVTATLDDANSSLAENTVYNAEIVTESTTPISFLFKLE